MLARRARSAFLRWAILLAVWLYGQVAPVRAGESADLAPGCRLEVEACDRGGACRRLLTRAATDGHFACEGRAEMIRAWLAGLRFTAPLARLSPRCAVVPSSPRA